MNSNSIIQNWIIELKGGAYVHTKIPKRFSRVWRKIFRIIPNVKGSIFEVGVGGGKHLIQFAVDGWEIYGVDCSSDVLERALSYISKVKILNGNEISVCDFMDFQINNKYDLVFHVGVVEHYRDNDERLNFVRKMFSIVKPNGYLISIVPINIQEKTPGVPEIYYTSDIMRGEFKKIGGKIIKIFPHNLKGIFAPLPIPIEKYSSTLVGILQKIST